MRYQLSITWEDHPKTSVNDLSRLEATQIAGVYERLSGVVDVECGRYYESLGRKAILDNLQTLCRSCNTVKGVKCPE